VDRHASLFFCFSGLRSLRRSSVWCGSPGQPLIAQIPTSFVSSVLVRCSRFLTGGPQPGSDHHEALRSHCSALPIQSSFADWLSPAHRLLPICCRQEIHSICLSTFKHLLDIPMILFRRLFSFTLELLFRWLCFSLSFFCTSPPSCLLHRRHNPPSTNPPF